MSVLSNENVDIEKINGREFYLVGTAHVSEASVRLAEDVIREVTPDCVAIELCDARYKSLNDPNRWRNTDIFQIIKSGRYHVLLSQLLLLSMQRRIGKTLNVKPGEEMLRAAKVAEELALPISLADRDVKITLKRTWGAVSFWEKCKLLFSILGGIFGASKIKAAEIEEMKGKDKLQQLINDMATSYPRLKAPLIDERDAYLASKIYSSPGSRIVAIVGAGHIPGIKKLLGQVIDLPTLETIPPKTKTAKIISWIFPALIVGLVLYGALAKGAEKGLEMAGVWAFVTAIPSAIGAALAFAHPLAILAAGVSAPFTSVHPLLAAGWFSGLTEAYFRKPTVSDLENLPDDITTIKGFFTNRVTRVLLVIAFTNLGCTVGMVIGIPLLSSLLS